MAKATSNSGIIYDEDGLPVMEIGGWSEQKHLLIKKFVDASWAARSRFTQRTYIDLYCGPGKVQVRGEPEINLGSPLVAWTEAAKKGGAFTEVFIGDANPDSLAACQIRLEKAGAPVIAYLGTATQNIDEIMPKLKERSGLHLVVLDPFNIGALDFSIIQKLSKLRSVDVIVHFSVMDLQRNIDSEYAGNGTQLQSFAPNWRNHVHVHEKNKSGAREAFWDYWVNLVKSQGFKVAGDKVPLFKNSTNSALYGLVLLYKHDLALKLWNDVAKSEPDQRDLF